MSGGNVTPIKELLGRPELEAIVISDDDPEGLMRVKVRVYGLMDGVPDEDLPFAEYKLPVGCRMNSGDFQPVLVGDIVWVDFPYRTHNQIDTRRPRITGSKHFCPGGEPNLPHEAWDGANRIEHKRTGNEPVPELSEYHESRVLSQFGIVVEIERPGVYRITHRETGTAFEIGQAGDTVLHSESRSFFSSSQETEFEVGDGLVINVLSGNAAINVDDGNAVIAASGDTAITAGGDAQVKADGEVTHEAGGDITLKAAGKINLQAGGALNVRAARFDEVLG